MCLFLQLVRSNGRTEGTPSARIMIRKTKQIVDKRLYIYIKKRQKKRKVVRYPLEHKLEHADEHKWWLRSWSRLLDPYFNLHRVRCLLYSSFYLLLLLNLLLVVFIKAQRLGGSRYMNLTGVETFEIRIVRLPLDGRRSEFVDQSAAQNRKEHLALVVVPR